MGPLTATIVDEAEHSVNGADLDYLTGEVPTAIEQSLDGLKQVAKIVSAMKEFSHPDNDTKTPTDLNKAIESTITVARNEWKYVAEVIVDLDPQLPLVPCYPGEINQVLLNLIVNAAHAIGEQMAKAATGKEPSPFDGPRHGRRGHVRQACCVSEVQVLCGPW